MNGKMLDLLEGVGEGGKRWGGKIHGGVDCRLMKY